MFLMNLNAMCAIFAVVQSNDFLTDDTGSTDWWGSFIIGESYGTDWLWFLAGVIFCIVVCFLLYSAMLYNQVAANRHPANFRKLLASLGILVTIIWFGYVFSRAFGLPLLALLGGIWLVVSLVFFFTRRKSALPQT
jgi:ABC-type xylose transport system permease subunit